MTLNDLTINFSHIDVKSLLTDWAWLIGKEKLPILLTASGDAFLQDINGGSILVLDTAAGDINIIAESADEFSKLLTDKDFVSNYFAVNMIDDLLHNNIILNKGEIYSFKKPPILGGEYVLNNIEKTDIEVHFSILGQIHKQVKDLPEGTPINEITAPNKQNG